VKSKGAVLSSRAAPFDYTMNCTSLHSRCLKHVNIKSSSKQPNERRETLIKITATLVTFLVLGLLTCILIAWLVWQMPGYDYNQGIYYNI
jgi:hypothetical protein